LEHLKKNANVGYVLKKKSISIGWWVQFLARQGDLSLTYGG